MSEGWREWCSKIYGAEEAEGEDNAKAVAGGSQPEICVLHKVMKKEVVIHVFSHHKAENNFHFIHHKRLYYKLHP